MPEVERRAEYLGRAMKEGLTPLWALISVAITLVGGSVTVAVIWGVKHLIWVPIIVLLVLLVVLAEGSYRVARNRETEHGKRLAELQGERDAKANELDETRRELEEARRAALPAPAAAGPTLLPLVPRYYSRPASEIGDWVTAHLVGVSNPSGQAERRARTYLVGMEPYPRNILEPRYAPVIAYTLPPQSGGDPAAGLLIKPGQEEPWVIGYSGTGGDGNMNAGGFAVPDQRWRGLPWRFDPDERWRLSYRVASDGAPDVLFSVVAYAEDGQIKLHQEG